MTVSRFIPIIAVSIFFISCKKSNSPNNSINVSAQWHFDISGNILSGYPDSQWHSLTFTAKELALFQSLDTINLAGTTKPDSVNASFYPNPFISEENCVISFPNQYRGKIILKYVIVDSLMNPLDKEVFIVQNYDTTALSYPALAIIASIPHIPAERCRLYYTLSAQGNNNFFESWGNIQKTGQ